MGVLREPPIVLKPTQSIGSTLSLVKLFSMSQFFETFVLFSEMASNKKLKQWSCCESKDLSPKNEPGKAKS